MCIGVELVIPFLSEDEGSSTESASRAISSRRSLSDCDCSCEKQSNRLRAGSPPEVGSYCHCHYSYVNENHLCPDIAYDRDP